jgi:two-component system response regulator PilR (NtrC family)
MNEKPQVLLVHHNSDTLRDLQQVLERQGVRVAQGVSCADARRLLRGPSPFPLVFAETQLPDGTWADILALAEKAARPVNVIVVARLVDTRFYVEAIEAGAFDYIAPPFNSTDVRYVMRTALDDVIARRTSQHGSARAAEPALFPDTHEVGMHVR